MNEAKHHWGNSRLVREELVREHTRLTNLEAVDINDRARYLLKHLTESYLAEGLPVGSKNLLKSSALNVSSATVRNVMADLEARGLVTSPHTSAGKIPTNLGLRFYVNSLISLQSINRDTRGALLHEITTEKTARARAEATSRLLSSLTQLACVVTTPDSGQDELRQIEFMRLSDDRILVVCVINEQEIQNRIIEPDKAYSDNELQHASEFINKRFAGHTLREIRQQILDSMQSDQTRMSELMQTALDVATSSGEKESDFVVSGERNLVNLVHSAEEVQVLLDAFASKSAVVHLLDECIGADGIQMFIGDESGYTLLDDYSVITQNYEVESTIAGVLGVVGPTRMDYRSVIPLVTLTAQMLGSAIESPK